MDWFGQGTLKTPSHLQAHSKCCATDSDLACPFGERLLLPVPLISGAGTGAMRSHADRLLYGPSTLDARIGSATVYSGEPCEFGHGHPLAEVDHVQALSAISLLLKSCLPSAVVRRVRAVIVNTAEGVLRRWARSHVGVEPTEVSTPFRNHVDASSSVILIPATRRVVAPSDSPVPRSVLRSSGHSMHAKLCASLGHVGNFTISRTVRT